MKANARVYLEYDHMAPQLVAEFAHVQNACECAASYTAGPYAEAVAVETVMDGRWCTFYRRHIGEKRSEAAA